VYLRLNTIRVFGHLLVITVTSEGIEKVSINFDG
jgi:hypothetical protein